MHSISVDNLNKDFRIYERPQDRLLELILRKPRHRVFHVLQDISFNVLEGRSLGIIGDNGAGKSTLMKCLVGTLQPSSGAIDIRGQVAALLELGAGFHPEFSGRRNIYLNASLLGVPDDDIEKLENDIIEFSELQDFIDQPVKTYSSGMYVRLAFSIATMVRPDVLVIDEALSVGDIAFQKKCVQRMNEFRQQQKTMVFCSHSMYHVQELCDTAIWLEKGRIREIGKSEDVVANYEDYCNSRRVYTKGEEHARSHDTATPESAKDCRIIHTLVKNMDGEVIDTVAPLQDIVLELKAEILNDNVNCYFGFALMKDLEEVLSSYLATDRPDVESGPFRKGEIITVRVTLRSMCMRVGSFHVLGGVADSSGLLWYETRLSKEVKIQANKGLGAFVMNADWSVIRD
ncbi:ABC transporter ATP-binding protein [Pseudohongiella spirulinae]|uniref:ABC transporter, ATP-binding protein n=1 Tax=Pseudohongiella spirulinae TaxID=1249552 RepID=A0A0S2K8U2_9GAMM|nr:polysaccharide ABC transporter ATP-binding protein [Pseudohongiella spirulinae]ALO44752.1 ABC transporter, ATP-binding protein [Pseudohongiella spirulinae]